MSFSLMPSHTAQYVPWMTPDFFQQWTSNQHPSTPVVPALAAGPGPAPALWPVVTESVSTSPPSTSPSSSAASLQGDVFASNSSSALLAFDESPLPGASSDQSLFATTPFAYPTGYVM